MDKDHSLFALQLTSSKLFPHAGKIGEAMVILIDLAKEKLRWRYF